MSAIQETFDYLNQAEGNLSSRLKSRHNKKYKGNRQLALTITTGSNSSVKKRELVFLLLRAESLQKFYRKINGEYPVQSLH